MQGIRQLETALHEQRETCGNLFSIADLNMILPHLDAGAFRAVLWRAEKAGLLKRVCRGLYTYSRIPMLQGLVLYRAVSKLRPLCMNYLSLESVLSDAGVISQVPMNWVSLMSSGRSHVVDCGDYGHIEFVHTAQRPDDVAGELVYDPARRLWRASVRQALRDMKATRRSLELVDEEVLHELV